MCRCGGVAPLTNSSFVHNNLVVSAHVLRAPTEAPTWLQLSTSDDNAKVKALLLKTDKGELRDSFV